MKKYLVLLCCLILMATVAASKVIEVPEAVAKMNISVVGGGVPAAGGGATDYTADGNCQGAWLHASGNELIDSSGEGNTLTNNNAVTFSSASLPNSLTTGQYATFDGVDQYLSVANVDLSASFPGKGLNDDFAYCFWIRLAGDQNDTGIIGSDADYSISFDSGTDLDIFVHEESGDGGAQYEWDDVVDWTSNTAWHHVCFSFDGSATQGAAWISTESSFGDEVNGTTETYTNVDSVDGGSQPFLYGYVEVNEDYIDADIFQVIMFNRTISGAEAEEMYDNGIDGGG